MLEAALIYGCFMFMAVAILDVGHYMFLHQSLVERARNSARYGAARTFDETAIRNKVLYDSATVPADPNPIFGLDASNVQVTQTPGAALGSPTNLTVRISGWRYFRFTPNHSGQTDGQDIVVVLPMETP